MKTKYIKWMILLIPTLTVGIWEYVRHQFLLSYITMDLGNWLTPLIVYLVSVTLLSQLFRILERMQRELEQERSATIAWKAREQLANELHDGIAQSLFLLSVKVDRLEGEKDPQQHQQDIYQIRKTVHEVNRYVRQAITDLKVEPEVQQSEGSHETLEYKLHKLAQNAPMQLDIDWRLTDEELSPKETIELLACIREAVVNIEKHSGATTGLISGEGSREGWTVTVKDNGRGFEGNPFAHPDRYGLNIMKERAKAMQWKLKLCRDHDHTVVAISKEGEKK
ncbi:sensor histidine kinase [Paenibacillus donghaensis]|uniref:histidine kinase n=1 Tax=Paenibacillus donghaensis TaxID=414771 RepID=A0A2Z2KVI8_9BACL|nr:histidine kinase [Paenibacillus donghaensis]ASA26302.1 two-component sensor histidine kinase [Paenibacillus donghaensis]